MKVAVYQSCTPGATPSERLERLEEEANKAGAELLLCPELFLSGYAIGAEVARHAEAADGPFAAGVARIARKTGTAIVYGYPEAGDGRVYNSARCIGATGEALANHRKTVLPPGYEPDVFAPGEGMTLFELGGITFGLIICYETEFPEPARALSMAGAQVLLAPTALQDQWGVVARQLIPTRAFENGVYLLYANHGGAEADMRYLGESCIVGPDGKDLVRAGAGEEVLSAEIDPARVTAAQARLPYHRDLPDLRARMTER